ncbi:hypothetical protein [Thioalkalivibrio sp. ALMg11]|uniref:hypothetical protein n=1 Tax=Thioalkalivibrio sp. ALMg11 TaxID=1158165 RepID=UPI0005B4AAEE|nr:hypothetical protein [Thioalkalivibrio sp. ALMg11]
MLVLAIAGLPALAAAVGMEDGHAGHTVQGAQSKGDAEHEAHDHGHDAAHHHHAHGDRAGHAGSPHGSDPAPSSGHSQASELLVHVDCVDAACLAACAACSHCQGMPSITGMSVLTTVAQGASLHSFQSGPSAVALHRPPILS